MEKNKKRRAEKTYRSYAYWGLAFLSLATVFFLLLLTFGILLETRYSGGSPINWIFFYFGLATLVGSLLLAFLFYWLRSRMKSEQSASFGYFSKPTFVYTSSAFSKTVRKLSNTKKKKIGDGIVACLNIKGINSDILNFYGVQEVKEINSIAYDCIASQFQDPGKYSFGFSSMNCFLLYTKSIDAELFEHQLRDLGDQIGNKVAARGKIGSLTVLFGSCPLRECQNVDEAIDHAMLASKYNAMNRFSSAVAPFSKDQMSLSNDERELPSDILRAIKEEQFQIFYQPKFNLRTNRFYGAEALVRWNHPTRGLLPPSFFIPFSERAGLIVDLDHYIYEHALRDLSKWENGGERLVKLSINLSRRTVYDEGLLGFLSSTADRFGVEHKWLDIELTESLAARDAAFLYQLVSKIKGLSMATSIDDFGVGYSSFNSLKKLPFDTLKIDKSFIDDIEVDKKSRDIVQAIISLSHSLGIWTIAEGVETEKQVTLLKGMGLDAVQGYYYSRPLNSFEFQRFLKSNPFETPLEKGEKK